MGYWLCKQHGKTIHARACTHLKQGVENKISLNFNLVLEEISQTNTSYISNMLCDNCSNSIEISNKCVIFFNPQIRKYEQHAGDDFDEKDIQHDDMFSRLSNKLTSICYLCLLAVYPDYQSLVEAYKMDAVEIEKKAIKEAL